MAIELSFLGAAQNVTGSRYLIETESAKVLVECGLYQERQLADRNWKKFPVSPREIDAVLLTHAHLDHCGLLPKLVKDGFRGKIYCTSATAELAQIILLDSAHLQEEDAEYKMKRHRKEGREPSEKVKPLYTTEDAKKTLPKFSSVDYEETVEVAEGIQARFFNAGHVLGSSMISVKVTEGERKRTLVFSGDVGRWDMPIIQDPTLFKHADYVLVESTYGDRVHPETGDVKEELARVINEAVEAGGNVVIPVFALERSQDILYHLNELLMQKKIPELTVFLDSPMAIGITGVFEKHPELFDPKMSAHVKKKHSPFEFPGLHMTVTTAESKAINSIKGTAIILAGSGMCNGGRVKHHLVNNIMRPQSTILFVGYQAIGTLGRQIVEGAREVRILGRLCPVKANIRQISGFSAHADRDELMRWMSGLQKSPMEVFVVHGEPRASNRFRDYLAHQKNWKVTVPAYGDKVTLE